MKKIMITSSLMLMAFVRVLACEVCKANQPRILQDITHGEGPQGTIDYIITWSATIVVVVALVLSVKFLVRPKENDKDHIKYLPVIENK